MTDTTSLGFIYPEDTDYPDTRADVPRAVQEALESVDDFLLNGASMRSLVQGLEDLNSFATLGYQNSWTDGADAAQYRRDVTGRVHLQGSITAGSLDATVVDLPSGFQNSQIQRWTVPYRDSDFAIVEVNSSSLKVVFAPADPAGENIYLDGISWRVTA